MTDNPSSKSAKLKKTGNDFAEAPLKDKIGSNLKKIYDDVVNEEVPADFLALLAKADKQDN